MKKRAAIDRVERKAASAQYRDGILELFAAALFLAIALFWVADLGVFLALLALPVVLGAGIAVPWVKERVTYPRIGYAETHRATDEASAWGGVAFIGLGIALMIGAVAVAVSGDIADVTSWRRWAPFFLGFLCSAGFWYAAELSRLWRYRIIAVFSVVLGLAVSLTSDGSTYQPVGLYAAVMATVLAVPGAVTLGMFLVRHPKATTDPTTQG